MELFNKSLSMNANQFVSLQSHVDCPSHKFDLSGANDALSEI